MSNLVEELIIEQADKYVGQHEKPGNMGFKVKWFDKLMRSVGFKDSHPWCVYLCELVWREFYKENDPRKLSDIERLFTGGAVRTFKRFQKDPNWETGTIPRRGAIAFWQMYENGKATTRGHAAVCTISGVSDKVYTIDGNTNDNGSREGIKVAYKSRRNNFGEKKGLVLIGFVYPQGIEGT